MSAALARPTSDFFLTRGRGRDLFDFLAASSKYGIQRGIELALAWIAIALHARISQGGSTSLGYWQNLEKKNLLQFWLAHSEKDRKSTRLNSSHSGESRMPSSA